MCVITFMYQIWSMYGATPFRWCQQPHRRSRAHGTLTEGLGTCVALLLRKLRTHRAPPLDFNMMTTAILVGLMGLVYGQQASITSNGGDITVGLGSSGSLYVQPATGNRLSVATAADTAAIQAAIDMVNNALLTSP
jgi:hypothetical protein